jgi:RNA polymerase sigma-70 factor (ECF subfamily)
MPLASTGDARGESPIRMRGTDESEVARWIEAARGGDRDARGLLFERYRAYLRLVARASLGRRLRAKADASDVVQSALLAADAGFSGFRGRSERELAAWLRAVLAHEVVRLARRFVRNRGRDVARERSLDDVTDASSAPESLAARSASTPSRRASRREAGVVLTEALDRLDPDHREVLLLRDVEGLDWAEVGRRLGRSPDAARMLWARALTKLRPQVEGLR